MTAPAADTPKKSILSAFAPFPKPFWVINGVELFERGAYYGMLAVLSVFMINTLELSAPQIGILLAVQFPLLYFLPVVAAALADKVGFKTLLIFTFVVLTAGYVTLALSTGFWSALGGIVLFGIGAGAFKPIPAATVSQTTSEDQRNFGFAIYYWLINAGAFVAPIAMATLFGTDYRPFFWVAAGLSVFNLIVCLALWRDLKPADKGVRVGEALRGLRELAKAPAFIVLLIIYTGFWFMYAITTSFLSIYMIQYGVMGEWFVPFIISLNAGTILLLGPILGKVTTKVPSLPLMIAGITIYVGGFVLLGFTNIAALFVLGIVIFSAGEFITHPSYLSYVTKIAPPHRVAVFLGYGFLPIGVGQFLGSIVGGVMYDRFADQMGQPQLFWAAISAIGLITIAAMLIYNMFMTRRLRPAAEPVAPVVRRRRAFIGAPLAAAVVLLLVPALVVAGAMATPPASVAPGENVEPLSAGTLATLALPVLTGSTDEGKTSEQTVVLPDNATGLATVILQWKDEAASGPGQTNAPDSFRVHITHPDGTMTVSDEIANPQGGEGKIAVTFPAAPGSYVIGVELVSAGDITTGANGVTLPGVGTTADTKNAWDLGVAYQAPA